MSPPPALALSGALLQAFLATRYTALTPFGPVEIRIGKRHPVLDRELARCGHDRWVYIGACNPRAQLLDDAHNRRRHLHFGRLLARLGRPGWSGHGLPADAAWPPEPAWLVPGLDAALAHRLALRYGQLAYVCGGRETVAELLCSGLSSP